MAGRRKIRKGRRPLDSALLVRWALVLVVSLAAAWLTIAISGASLMRSGRPDLALRFWPPDARARANSAEKALVEIGRGRDSGNRDRARALSISALERDATVVSAWRTLALTMRDPAAMAPLVHFANDLSRRDLPTQLWLIEEQVARNNIPQALVHYDSALRSTTRSYDILLPVLVQAMRHDDIAEAVVPLLRANPPWRFALLERYSQQPGSANTVGTIAGAVLPDATDRERALLAATMRTLVEQGQFASAIQLCARLGPGCDRAPLPRNPGFEGANTLPPFYWQIESSGQFGAEQRRSETGSGQVLHIYGEGGSGGHVASQLLTLRPGTYRLSATIGPSGGVRPGRFYWELGCAGTPGTRLVEAEELMSPQRRVSAQVRVPAENCAAQWLRLGIRADFDPGGIAGWVDDFTLRREP